MSRARTKASSCAAPSRTSRCSRRRSQAFVIFPDLDDFGTDYSSRTHLLDFPVDIVKLDRSFIGDIDSSEHCFKLVSAIIGMVQQLGLNATYCNLLRGFYFAAPCLADIATRFDRCRPFRRYRLVRLVPASPAHGTTPVMTPQYHPQILVGRRSKTRAAVLPLASSKRVRTTTGSDSSFATQRSLSTRRHPGRSDSNATKGLKHGKIDGKSCTGYRRSPRAWRSDRTLVCRRRRTSCIW
ncbi:MAG: EAL domain-containing protein [Myxococcota bacterium]